MRSQFSSSGPSRSDWERSRYEGEQQPFEYGRSRPRSYEGGYSEPEYGERPEYQSQAGRYGEAPPQGGWGGSEAQPYRGGYRQETPPSSYPQGPGLYRPGREGGPGGYEAEDFGRGYGGGQERYYGQSAPHPFSPRYEQGGPQGFGGGSQAYGRQEFGPPSGYGEYGGQHSIPYEQPAGQRSQSSRTRRGPKDFVRSDERIREAVCERLCEEESVDLSEVSVDVKDGCVTLEGSVPERRMRHTIEDIADNCWGVKDVENHVRVQAQSAQTGQAGSSEGSFAESSKGGASASAKSRSREEQKEQSSH